MFEENEGAILKELCGHNNRTTANIAEKFAKIQAAAKNRARAGEEYCSLTQQEREWAINSLSFIARDVGRKGMGEIGIRVGRDLYESVKTFSLSENHIYTTPPENFPGRKRLRHADEIPDKLKPNFK